VKIIVISRLRKISFVMKVDHSDFHEKLFWRNNYKRSMRQTHRKLGQMVQAGAYSSSDQQQVMDTLRDIATRRTARRRTKLASHPYRLEVDLQYILVINGGDVRQELQKIVETSVLNLPCKDKIGTIEKLHMCDISDINQLDDNRIQIAFRIRGNLSFQTLYDVSTIAGHLINYPHTTRTAHIYEVNSNKSVLEQYNRTVGRVRAVARSSRRITPDASSFKKKKQIIDAKHSNLRIFFRDVPIFSLIEYPNCTHNERLFSAINTGMIQYIVSKMDESLTTGSTTGTDKKRSPRRSTQITTTRPT